MPATDTTIDALDEQVSALSAAGQAELARRIIARLEVDETEETEGYWAEEIERRLAEYDAGLVEGIPAAEVFARVRRDVREDGDEILRRLHELRDGTAETYSAEDVLQEMRARFG